MAITDNAEGMSVEAHSSYVPTWAAALAPRCERLPSSSKKFWVRMAPGCDTRHDELHRMLCRACRDTGVQ